MREDLELCIVNDKFQIAKLTFRYIFEAFGYVIGTYPKAFRAGLQILGDHRT